MLRFFVLRLVFRMRPVLQFSTLQRYVCRTNSPFVFRWLQSAVVIKLCFGLRTLFSQGSVVAFTHLWQMLRTVVCGVLRFPPKVITSLCYVAARLKFYVNTIWSQLCNPSYGLRQRLTSFFLLRLLHLLIYLVCQVLHHWCQRTLYWIHLFLHQNHLATFANKICNHFTLFALWPWLTHISTISNKTATFKPKLVLRITV